MSVEDGEVHSISLRNFGPKYLMILVSYWKSIELFR